MIKENRSFDISEITKLGEVFRRYPGIRAVYLFGSAPSGHAHPDSDVDLAVIPADTSAREKKLDILAELADHGYCNVDLVFIDENDLILANEAIRQNKLIYATDDFDRGTTYSNIVRKYLDFEFFLRAQHHAYKRRNAGVKT
ncbi:MAG: nucleotidyltransferase domain-containing protein [Candidatus Bipolaricaulota bacterium]|nr:nucleotidyltransferase domain-containing protein [Candidatus Bipolaricaulota bacterium]